MPLQVSMGGSQVIAGPVGAQAFPSAAVDVTFQLNPDPKAYSTTTGAGTFTVNSPNSFATMGSIGTGGLVLVAHTLFLRSNTQMKVRITQLDPGNAPTTTVFTFGGLFVFEPANGYEVTLVEFQGAGQVECVAFGNQ